MTQPLENGQLDILRKTFAGEIVTPDADGYDTARRVWNGMIDRRPGAIARATSVDDVIAAVEFARDHDALLAVRCGGHSGPGFSTCDGGLVLDLGLMNSVAVDPDRRTATVAGGALLGDLDRASAEHGLATTAGVVSHTGVGGLTLGGGLGRLHRKYGLTIDNLLSCEVVTASGEIVRADAKENAELFWGLRGAGHNFGVVTSFEFRLHPHGPNVLGAMAFYPLEQASEALARYRAWAAALDDDRISGVQLGTIPASMPFPEEIHGKKGALVIGLHVDGDAPASSLEAIAGFGTPAFTMNMPIPYVMLQAMSDEAYAHGKRAYVKGGLMTELSDATVDTALAAIAGTDLDGSAVAFLQMGGAIARVPEDATAFSGRSSAFALNIEIVWTDATQDSAYRDWTRATHESLSPALVAANYVNLVEDAGADMRPVYGDAKYDRLVALKRTWDPGNLFRLNQNIAP
jgi:FAD/FMN-containing dehydrogenase